MDGVLGLDNRGLGSGFIHCFLVECVIAAVSQVCCMSEIDSCSCFRPCASTSLLRTRYSVRPPVAIQKYEAATSASVIHIPGKKALNANATNVMVADGTAGFQLTLIRIAEQGRNTSANKK